MTRKCVTDEQYGKLQRKLGELARRIDEGTLEYGGNLKMLQMAIEGRLFDHVKSGGLVLSRPMIVDISTVLPKKIQRSPCGVEVSEELMHELLRTSWSFPSMRVSIQTAYFDFFGDRQPGTSEIVARLHARGYRQATTLELYCATHQHKLCTGAESEYFLALFGAPEDEKILQCKYDPALGPCFEFSKRDQPWWPYCYRFVVVKIEDAESKT